MFFDTPAKPPYLAQQVISTSHLQTDKFTGQVPNRLLNVAKLAYTAYNGLEMLPIEIAKGLHHLLLLSAKTQCRTTIEDTEYGPFRVAHYYVIPYPFE
jgi:hypothetical protein